MPGVSPDGPVVNHAQGLYEDFDGDGDFELNVVGKIVTRSRKSPVQAPLRSVATSLAA